MKTTSVGSFLDIPFCGKRSTYLENEKSNTVNSHFNRLKFILDRFYISLNEHFEILNENITFFASALHERPLGQIPCVAHGLVQINRTRTLSLFF